MHSLKFLHFTMIHWFPGHMHKASKDLSKLMSKIDIVIEILDSRAPKASGNPILRKIIGNKPVVRILSRADLADLERTAQWIKFYRGEAIALNIIKDKKAVQKIVNLCKKNFLTEEAF